LGILEYDRTTIDIKTLPQQI